MLPGTSVSSTTYNWLITIQSKYGRQSGADQNLRFVLYKELEIKGERHTNEVK